MEEERWIGASFFLLSSLLLFIDESTKLTLFFAAPLPTHPTPSLACPPHHTQSITLVDLTPLAVVPKSVAPIPSQDALETRKVWEPVCLALYKKDYSTASKEKQRIEQEQRDKAEERKKKGEGYAPKYFEREPEDVREWDGRPVLTEEGRRVIERDFEASYEI